MPVSSVISYQIGGGLFDNIIRIQTIILSLLFVSKCKDINFLVTYVLGCAGIAIIINFYQLRYVLTFIFAYSLFIGARKEYKYQHIKKTLKTTRGT